MVQRRDAFGNRSKSSKKKSAAKGSGGKGRRSLQGKGPTPKAENRPYHVKYKERVEREQRQDTQKGQARQRKKASMIHIPQGSELIVGRNPVAEAARSGLPIKRVFIAANLANDDRLSDVVRIATRQGAPVLEVPRSDLDIASEGEVHQGIGIEVPPYQYATLEEIFAHASRTGQPPLIVMLDNVTDPHNLGAVLRSAAAFGAHGVVIPSRRSASMNATAWKVSAGAAASVAVAQVPNLVSAIKKCQDKGCFAIGLDGGGQTTVKDSNLAKEPLVVVTGAEGKGLSRLTRETCDVIASIPISTQMESLNAAVATGIALYEVSQCRGTFLS